MEDPSLQTHFLSLTTHRDHLYRSLSSNEPSFSKLALSPPRFSTASPSQSLHQSPPPVRFKEQGTRAYTRCISSLLQKDGQILSLDVSNGYVCTGTETKSIRIWKLPDFTIHGCLKAGCSGVRALSLSRDHVFAAYTDLKIRIWHRSLENFPVGRRKVGLKLSSYFHKDHQTSSAKHLGAITSLAVNTFDNLLYSASVDKTVRVWRISDLRCIETIEAHKAAVNAIALGGDGIVFTGSDDATVKVWRRSYSEKRRHCLAVSLLVKVSPVKALALGKRGTQLYAGCSDGYVHFWVRACFSGQMQFGGVLRGHKHVVMCLACVGQFVVSGSADSTIRVWYRDRENFHICLGVLEGHIGPVKCLVAVLDGDGDGDGDDGDEGNNDNNDDSGGRGCKVYSGSVDGVLKVWQVRRISHASEEQVQEQDTQNYFEI
ncbi:protein JINGUBANG [Amborella trichopoda]|uniref:protein JINGUBANG n=1 Tax=Amborella trichopoda TaxID=13333 RepID=UPI0009BDCC91|nr:protein JINGUBANG [Amborella trichopoda]|eukprot:XP_020518350.1 protein JINGUBANG [Amborella trichopoda]